MAIEQDFAPPQGNGKTFKLTDVVRITSAFLASGDDDDAKMPVEELFERLYGVKGFQTYLQTMLASIPESITKGMDPRTAIAMLLAGAFQLGYVIACERTVDGFEVPVPSEEAIAASDKRIREREARGFGNG